MAVLRISSTTAFGGTPTWRTSSSSVTRSRPDDWSHGGDLTRTDCQRRPTPWPYRGAVSGRRRLHSVPAGDGSESAVRDGHPGHPNLCRDHGEPIGHGAAGTRGPLGRAAVSYTHL